MNRLGLAAVLLALATPAQAQLVIACERIFQTSAT